MSLVGAAAIYKAWNAFTLIPTVTIKSQEAVLSFRAMNQLSAKLKNGLILNDFHFNSHQKEFFRSITQDSGLGHRVLLLSTSVVMEIHRYGDSVDYITFPLTRSQYDKVEKHFKRLSIR